MLLLWTSYVVVVYLLQYHVQDLTFSVKFEVLTAVSMKILVLCEVMPCRLVIGAPDDGSDSSPTDCCTLKFILLRLCNIPEDLSRLNSAFIILGALCWHHSVPLFSVSPNLCSARGPVRDDSGASTQTRVWPFNFVMSQSFPIRMMLTICPIRDYLYISKLFIYVREAICDWSFYSWIRL